jgi:hypothetical protein
MGENRPTSVHEAPIPRDLARRGGRLPGSVTILWLAAAEALSLIGLVSLPAVARAEGATADATLREKQACVAAADEGQTQRDDGKYRAARASFLRCAAASCPRVVVQSCTQWLQGIDDNAPTIVLGAKDEHGADLTDVTVSLDGVTFATELEGKPLEADSGEHVLRFEHPGSVPVEQKVVLRAAEKARVVSVTLYPAPPGEPNPSSSAEDRGVEPRRTRESARSAHHVIAGSLAVAALAAATTAVVLLVAEDHDKSDASSLRTMLGESSSACTNGSTATCISLADKVNAQRTDQNLSTGLFAGAAALLAGAAVTWFAWPHARTGSDPTTGTIVVVPGGATLQMAGRF